VIGASGYTGAELIRLLAAHPNVEIRLLTGERYAGQSMGNVFPSLAGFAERNALPDMVKLTEIDWDKEDVQMAFACLPHGLTQKAVGALPEHIKVVDLSADFRLRDPEVYEEWYGGPHQELELQQQVVYGLPELQRDAIKAARVVANPGCYPTSVQLPLCPLIRSKLVETDPERGGHIVIDSASGSSGAGRAPKEAFLLTEIGGSYAAYGVGSHRHMPEIEQELVQSNGGAPVSFSFTPHLLPIPRGILSTIYVKLAEGVSVSDAHACLTAQYAQERFVHVLPEGAGAPATSHVRGSNNSLISVTADRVPGRAVIVCAIDNLIKGASGQAIQNMNLQLGLPEDTGIGNFEPIYP